MRRIIPLLLLTACGGSGLQNGEGGAFAAFPNADGYAFACQFMTDGKTGAVFGTDAATDGQAFTYFGGETLRLQELESDVSPAGIDALYQAYDYPDFRVRLDVTSQPMKEYAGTLTLLRRQGSEFAPDGDAVSVKGSCAG